MRSVPPVLAVLLALVLAAAPDVALAQTPELSARFELGRTTARVDALLVAPDPDDSGAPGVWTAAAVGAGTGAVVGAAVGYVAYPHLLDPWLTRGQHTVLSAAGGALVGGAIGVAVALIRRRWARTGAMDY